MNETRRLASIPSVWSYMLTIDRDSHLLVLLRVVILTISISPQWFAILRNRTKGSSQSPMEVEPSLKSDWPNASKAKLRRENWWECYRPLNCSSVAKTSWPKAACSWQINYCIYSKSYSVLSFRKLSLPEMVRCGTPFDAVVQWHSQAFWMWWCTKQGQHFEGLLSLLPTMDKQHCSIPPNVPGFAQWLQYADWLRRWQPCPNDWEKGCGAGMRCYGRPRLESSSLPHCYFEAFFIVSSCWK